MGHARALLGLEQKRQQAEVAAHVAAKKLSVRETEALVRRMTETGPQSLKKRPRASIRTSRSSKAIWPRNSARKCTSSIRPRARASSSSAYRSLDELDGILGHIRWAQADASKHGSYSRMRAAHSLIRTSLTASLRYLALVCLYTAACVSAARADIVVDGRPKNPNQTAPRPRAPIGGVSSRSRSTVPRYGNRMSIVATPQGLAVFFVFDHPEGERRIKPRSPRDAERLIGESLMLLVDFDATGQSAYEFSLGLGGSVRDGLVTNQNEFDRDWDTASGSTPSAETRRSMVRGAADSVVEHRDARLGCVSHRTIAIYASRYLYDRAERFACPGLDSESSVFLADFKHVEVAQHEGAGGIDFVPYVAANADLVNDHTRFRTGADFHWKPSSQFRLAGDVEPGLPGQVESDELIINFSAIEYGLHGQAAVLHGERGDLRSAANVPRMASTHLYATNRCRMPDDARAGASDIDAGLKLSGTRATVGKSRRVRRARSGVRE